MQFKLKKVGFSIKENVEEVGLKENFCCEICSKLDIWNLLKEKWNILQF